MILIGQTILNSHTADFLPQNWRGAGLLNIPFIKQLLYWPNYLQVISFFCFFIPQMVNNPILYAAVMTLWLVAFPGFLIISSVSGIVNVMCLVIPAAACLLILGSLRAIIIDQWAQWNPYYKMRNHSISMCTGRYWHQSFWNKGLFSSPAEVSGFLEYGLHVSGIWIVICYRGLRFLERAAVLLVFSLWSYWPPECCIKQWRDKPTGDGCLQEVWAGGGMKNWHSCISFLIQVHWCAICNYKFQILIHTTDQTVHSHNR